MVISRLFSAPTAATKPWLFIDSSLGPGSRLPQMTRRRRSSSFASSEDYEPSQQPYHRSDGEEPMVEQAGSSLTDMSWMRSRLRDSTRSRALIAQQFVVGGALDSQTTDTQFVDYVVEGYPQCNDDSADDGIGSLADDEDSGRGSFRGSSDAPATEPEVAEDCPCAVQFRKLETELARAQRQTVLLQERLRYLQALYSLSEKRLQDLEYQQEPQDSDQSEPWLDPNEESQVLIGHVLFRTRGIGLGIRTRKRKRVDEHTDQVIEGEAGPSGRQNVAAASDTSPSELDGNPVYSEVTELSLVLPEDHGSGVQQGSGRHPVRANRMKLPARYQDLVPHGPSPLPPHRSPSPLASGSAHLPGDGVSVESSTQPRTAESSSLRPIFPIHPPRPVFRTKPNRFGLIREYIGEFPVVDPDDELPIEDLVESDLPSAELSPARPQISPHTATAPVSDHRSALIAPYPNMSTYLLGTWYWNTSRTKSTSDRNDLVSNVILHKEFVPHDLRHVNWAKIDKELANGSRTIFPTTDGWHHADVTISVPFAKDSPPRNFTVSGLVYRPLEEVVKAVCESHISARFHYRPFRLLWQPHTSAPEPLPAEQEVYGELYASKAFRDADAELQCSPREPGCNLPRAIIALMPWSDSTHLADFGDASLWPIYAQFGNQSKYTRARPSSNSCQHVAYIPKLPAEIHDFIHKFLQKEGIDPLLTHCRRELVQAIWRLLLSDKFVEACRHGIVVKCYDGVTRRLYIRIFTYSADYPEKVLLATIRDMGNCPCPRCLVPKDRICEIGTPQDKVARERKARVDDASRKAIVQQARGFIMSKGLGVNSTAVEAILKPQSLVPTLNAFSDRLGPDILPNFHSLFVPDFMHEWELGVWKGLMTHIVRILHAAKGGATREFNARFRKVPTFGRDVIRRFSANMSEMKQFAAHDFEDSLQCFIPVVDRLLPEPHNTIILDVVFLSAELHGLHKLHLHTEATTTIADAVLVEYGKALRRFKRVTCAAYHTVELPRETAARMRRQTHKAATTIQTPPSQSAMVTAASTRLQNTGDTPVLTSKRKEYNLNTYKHHSLGDYTASIRHQEKAIPTSWTVAVT
ncbi:hypothetical protein BN946_scf185033.g7 [Trametes cinnabarina]|uniref:Uncharacterized protein n=1 Tax=Pycnoporus cinnabarinus TaxID=5643 RepID=A0A060SR45_PYCCI|nr:hypothetical protein BN946_scf185033.g7 [Trametes cinnabarina]